HKSPGVRRNAAQVRPRKLAAITRFFSRIDGEEPDPLGAGLTVELAIGDAQTRMAALLAMADSQGTASEAQALAAGLRADYWDDPGLIAAATSAAAIRPSEFLIAAAAPIRSRQSSPSHLLTVTERVAEHYARRVSAHSDMGQLLTSIRNADEAMAGIL